MDSVTDGPKQKFVASRPSSADSKALRGCGLTNLTWVGVDKEELRERLVMPEYLRLSMRDSIKRKDSTAIPNHLLLPGGVVADMAPLTPMIVFINPKSGGRHGPVLKERLQQLMSDKQVFDLTEVKPNEFVRYGIGCLETVAAQGDECAKQCRARLRIMVVMVLLVGFWVVFGFWVVLESLIKKEAGLSPSSELGWFSSSTEACVLSYTS